MLAAKSTRVCLNTVDILDSKAFIGMDFWSNNSFRTSGTGTQGSTMEMDRKLDEILTRVNAIYLITCPGAAASNAEHDGTSDLPTLPLDTAEDLDAFNKFVSVEAQGISAVSIVRQKFIRISNVPRYYHEHLVQC